MDCPVTPPPSPHHSGGTQGLRFRATPRRGSRGASRMHPALMRVRRCLPSLSLGRRRGGTAFLPPPPPVAALAAPRKSWDASTELDDETRINSPRSHSPAAAAHHCRPADRGALHRHSCTCTRNLPFYRELHSRNQTQKRCAAGQGHPAGEGRSRAPAKAPELRPLFLEHTRPGVVSV